MEKMHDPGNILTNSENNLCDYTATFGVLLSLTCLAQHLIFAIPGRVTNPMIAGYILAIISFLLLGLKKPVSIILLIISTGFSFIIEYLWLTHYSFSLVVLLFFLYHVIFIIVLFTEQVPKKLKMKEAAEKNERDIWAGKI
jgi:hypothetical protein